MHELNTGLYQYVDKRETFRMFPEDSVSQLIRFANYPYTFYNKLNQERIKVYPLLAKRQLTCAFSKRHENMCIGVKRNAELFL